jgi:glycosyltransferase involved in cell wall biosynthesis
LNILFVHQNFPGQFKHLAPALAADPSNAVVAFTMRDMAPCHWNGVRVIPYAPNRGTSRSVHPWVADLETKVIRGEACLKAALSLKKEGFVPDVIVAHPGWGESLFLKDVWPTARLGMYCEFYYGPEGADAGFDPEFGAPSEMSASRLRVKNANNLLHFEVADAGLAPTQWQASTFPEPFRSRITVAHDGIDTKLVCPREDVSLVLQSRGRKMDISRSDEVITFVSRNLEPYRGYHIFMRALPTLLAARPNARVLIVGGDEVSYGSPPAGGGSWKDVLVREIRPQVSDADWQRVHFLGKLEYGKFIALLQLTTVHVYLTYPFVLSWSLLEAMSCGCAIVGSDTPPVREVIRDGETGYLTDFFDKAALARGICDLLDDAPTRQRLSANARELAVSQFDLKRICLPQQREWLESLAAQFV